MTIKNAALAAAAVLITLGCSASGGEAVRITADPDGASIAEPVRIGVDGLRPGSDVRVWARMTDRTGQVWESAAEFVADGAGEVDTTTSASEGGSYRGVDPHGLFWSMGLAPGRAAPYPLVSGDVVVELGVDGRGGALARTSVRRVVRPEGLRTVPVDEAGLVGDLYVPAGGTPRPGVLLLGGSEGGRPDPAYARVLAAQGFTVLGLAYFGEPGLPPALTGIPVEYGLAAAGWLAARSEVAGSRIGLVGTSKGAEYALLLASAEPARFGAVVAHVPSDVVWPGLAYDPGSGPRSSWSRGGVDVPFLGWTGGDGQGAARPAPGEPVRVAAAYAAAFAGATAEQVGRARIPVERITAPVLLTSGGDDGIWPSQPQAERLMSALDATGNPYGARHLPAPEAGHFVGGVPNLPATETALAGGPITFESGGRPAANAEAVRASFRATVELLAAALPR